MARKERSIERGRAGSAIELVDCPLPSMANNNTASPNALSSSHWGSRDALYLMTMKGHLQNYLLISNTSVHVDVSLPYLFLTDRLTRHTVTAVLKGWHIGTVIRY